MFILPAKMENYSSFYIIENYASLTLLASCETVVVRNAPWLRVKTNVVAHEIAFLGSETMVSRPVWQQRGSPKLGHGPGATSIVIDVLHASLPDRATLPGRFWDWIRAWCHLEGGWMAPACVAGSLSGQAGRLEFVFLSRSITGPILSWALLKTFLTAISNSVEL